MELEIIYANKVKGISPYEIIASIAVTHEDGTKWEIDHTDAIIGVETGKWSFYIKTKSGNRADVFVGTSPYGHKYLKTEMDKDEPGTLLKLGSETPFGRNDNRRDIN